ncbi:MAG: hypothetical protein KC800_00505 [Candidatus Eremiobacteraeota bacterium]|nr:hypothetical protein [Candidatus Eremiobacteraeota bacterium]
MSLFVMPLFVGCGDSDEFSGTTIQNNTFTSLLPVLSGQVGSLQLQTTLESVNAQTISIVTTNVVPTVVDEYRFLGFNADGVLIYGPVIRTKSANITLDQVPVEVVSLRIELLTDGLIVGGLSTAVDINTGETFLLNNPTFSFPQGATGPAGPPGAGANPAYGSYRADFGESGFEPGESVPFDTTVDEFGVTSLNDGATFQVTNAGDYLVTYFLNSEGAFVVRVNGNDQADTVFFEDSVSFVVSIPANGQLSLVAAPGQGGSGLFGEGVFTIVRLGDITAAPTNVEN